MRTQFDDGSWVNNEPFRDLPEVEIVSEFLVYLDVIIGALRT